MSAASDARPHDRLGHIIVCGLDTLALRVTTELRALGEEVVVLAHSHSERMASLVEQSGAELVNGSHLEDGDLRRAGVETASCLVLCQDDDLGNLHVALTAQELKPDLRVVIRMFNPELGSRAERLLSNCRAMSSSALAAPMLAAAAMGEEASGHVVAWGRRLLIHDKPADTEMLADLAEGDRHHYIHDGGSIAAATARQRLGSIRRGLRAMGALADRRLAAVLGVLTGLALLAVVVFHSFDGLAWVDSIYFTATTVTTVGYGDINLLTAPGWLKIFGVGVMLLGATALATLYALITDAVVGARIALAMGVPHGKMKNHYVVCGLGNVGYRVVENLVAAGRRVAAAEVKEHGRFIGLVRQLGVPVLVGDARLSENMRLLSVDRAAAVVAATDDDVANLEMALAARDLNPAVRVVVRVFDPELAERARRSLGLEATHSASALAAPAFAAAALEDGCLGTVGHKRRWLVAEVEANSALAGRPIAELIEEGEFDVLAASGNGSVSWHPDRDLEVTPEHKLLVCAPREKLRRLRAESAERS